MNLTQGRNVNDWRREKAMIAVVADIHANGNHSQAFRDRTFSMAIRLAGVFIIPSDSASLVSQ